MTSIQTIIKGHRLPATIEDGVGYADAEAVLAAYGIPVRTEVGHLQIGLRRFAEAFQRPHEYVQVDDLFYIDTPPLPPLPAEPVGMDVRPWHPVTAPITGGPGDRRRDLLQRIIQQFRVAVNPRYRKNQQGYDETYCNIFVWDCTRALGCEIPHWVVGDGEPSAPGRGRELDANAVVQWLRRRGPNYGWLRANEVEASQAAAIGRPAVAAWEHEGGIGHVALIRPEARHPTRGLAIAQSGATNSDTIYLADGFGQSGRSVEFYIHE